MKYYFRNGRTIEMWDFVFEAFTNTDWIKL